MLKIPVREHPPQPWATGLRLRHAPQGLTRLTVAAGSPADGAAVGDLGLSGRAWLSLASRDGELLPLHADRRLRAGDELLLHGGAGAAGSDVTSVFAAP